jgi:Tol biopolymer transport system component
LLVALLGVLFAPSLLRSVSVLPRTSVDETLQDVSPQAPMPPAGPLGKIAFEKDRDIWVKPLPDGEARRITFDQGSERPNWSPSGEWLLYHNAKGSVQIRHVSGLEMSLGVWGRQLRGPVMWSPTADTLAFLDENNSLTVMNAGEWHKRTLARGNASDLEEQRVSNFAWSPDGRHIAYIWHLARPNPQDGTNSLFSESLWLAPVDGSAAPTQWMRVDVAVMQQSGRALLHVWGWTPDGKRLIVAQQTLRADLNDTQPEASRHMRVFTLSVADGVQYDLPDLSVTPLGFSSDGTIVTHTAFPHEDRRPFGRLVTVDPATGAHTQLTDADKIGVNPAWSPDDRQIVYSGIPTDGALAQDVNGKPTAPSCIWIVNRDGSNARQLTHDATYRDEWPQWLNDGQHILFGRRDARYQVTLWLMDTTGQNLVQIADGLSPSGGDGFSYNWEYTVDLWQSPTQPVQTFAVNLPPPVVAPTPQLTPQSLDGATAEEVLRNIIAQSNQGNTSSTEFPTTGEVDIVETFPWEKGSIVVYRGFGREGVRRRPKMGALVTQQTGAVWSPLFSVSAVCIQKRPVTNDKPITFSSSYESNFGSVVYGQAHDPAVVRVEIMYTNGTIAHGNTANGYYAFVTDGDAATATVRALAADGRVIFEQPAMEFSGSC